MYHMIPTSEDEVWSPPPQSLQTKANQLHQVRPSTSSYISGFVLNEPINNNAISTVVKSATPRFKAGDVVIGNSNFSIYVSVPASRAEKEETEGGLSLLANPLGLDPKVFLGALGMPGLTAYSSFYEIGKPKKGETIFISAASGAVGQIVGQLAKREGMKVIGSVGSDAKLAFIKEKLGFDAGFNYKTENPEEALKGVFKDLGVDGLDVYYDNVGGEQLDAALGTMNVFGRISMFPYPHLSLLSTPSSNLIPSHPIAQTHTLLTRTQYPADQSRRPLNSPPKPTASRTCRL